jgi:hypothetical protein
MVLYNVTNRVRWYIERVIDFSGVHGGRSGSIYLPNADIVAEYCRRDGERKGVCLVNFLSLSSASAVSLSELPFQSNRTGWSSSLLKVDQSFSANSGPFRSGMHASCWWSGCARGSA